MGSAARPALWAATGGAVGRFVARQPRPAIERHQELCDRAASHDPGSDRLYAQWDGEPGAKLHQRPRGSGQVFRLPSGTSGASMEAPIFASRIWSSTGQAATATFAGRSSWSPMASTATPADASTPRNPYVQAATSDAQKAGVIVYSIYYRGAGRFDRNAGGDGWRAELPDPGFRARPAARFTWRALATRYPSRRFSPTFSANYRTNTS
jgi:hypothetical protein